MFSTSRKTKSVLPLPVLPQQMAVNGCLNGSTTVDLIISVGADVMVVVATVVVFEQIDCCIAGALLRVSTTITACGDRRSLRYIDLCSRLHENQVRIYYCAALEGGFARGRDEFLRIAHESRIDELSQILASLSENCSAAVCTTRTRIRFRHSDAARCSIPQTVA